MQLTPVQRRSAADGVFESILAEVVTGRSAPGTPLPAERALTGALGVSRQAVREALQRLGQAGIVSIRQGHPTTVLDYRTNAGLDLLPTLLVAPDGEIDPDAMESVMEMRECIGPDVARLAALRARPGVARTLGAIAAAMADRANDLDSLARLDAEFWDLLVEAADNIAYRLAFNSLQHTYVPARSRLVAALADELTDSHARPAIADAIVRKDQHRAERLARALLSKGTAGVGALLEGISGRET